MKRGHSVDKRPRAGKKDISTAGSRPSPSPAPARPSPPGEGTGDLARTLGVDEYFLVYAIERADFSKATPQDVEFRILGTYTDIERARIERRNAQEFYTLKYLRDYNKGGATDEERRAFIQRDFLKAWDLARKCDTWTFGSRFEIRSRRVRVNAATISPESGLLGWS